MSRGAGAKKSASPRQQSTKEFIKSALGSTEREPGWEYGQVLPVRARKNEEGEMEREWGLGYSNTAKGMLDAITLPRRAFEGEEVSPEQAMEMAMNITAPGVATARYAPGVLNMPIVYHGTPHRFAPTPDNPLGEFDASKIGTGEGAQAYGHGVYVAESPDVAKGYRESLSNNVIVDGKKLQTIPSDSPIAQAQNNVITAMTQQKMSPQDAIAYTVKYWNDAANEMAAFVKTNPELADRINKEVASRREIAKSASLLKPESFYKDPGALYTADLPDEMVDRMVDWDKPVQLQTPQVREALQSIIDETLGQGAFSEIIRSNPDFKDLQDNALESLTNAEISEALRQRGILGIKYLDEGSRGRGEGTRNFVLFPGEEKKAKILKRD